MYNYYAISLLVALVVSYANGFVSHQERRKAMILSLSTNDSNLSRRDVVKEAAALALASFLASSLPAEASYSSGKTIVMTGANSGIGLEACKRLAKDNTLILACRTQEKAEATVAILKDYGDKVIPATCDLTSMESIEKFAAMVPKLVSGPIDTVCLNAGLARNTGATDVARTKDGFELTVGTNHFGHFYLNRLLLPSIKQSGGRIVITASGVHDPDSPGGAQGTPAALGNLDGLRAGRSFEMVDGGSFNPDKAYKDSKLCNVLYTKELQKRLDANPSTQGIIANCFNPGLIVSTGLFRDQNPLFTRLFDFAATDLLKVGETPAWGGGCLDYMTGVTTKGEYYSSAPGSSRYGEDAYGRQFAVTETSKESRDESKAKELWDLTEKLLGI